MQVGPLEPLSTGGFRPSACTCKGSDDICYQAASLRLGRKWNITGKPTRMIQSLNLLTFEVMLNTWMYHQVLPMLYKPQRLMFKSKRVGFTSPEQLLQPLPDWISPPEQESQQFAERRKGLFNSEFFPHCMSQNCSSQTNFRVPN